MPRQTRYAGQDLTTLGGRFEYLLQHGWGGRQREMAADLGVSQGLISKVARGEQAPGPKLIEALAGHPKVNARWLLEGVGEPLVPASRSVPAGDLSLPVSRCILPGRPEEHPTLLTGLYLQAGGLFRPTMYLLEVVPDDPIVRVPELRVAVGDLLVMESDGAVWRSNPQILAGRLVAVRQGGGRGAGFALAVCHMDPVNRELLFDCFGVRVVPIHQEGEGAEEVTQVSGSKLPIPPAGTRQEAPSIPGPTRGRGVDLSKSPKPSGAHAEATPEGTDDASKSGPALRDQVGQDKLSIDSVVAFRVMLIRSR